MVGQNLDLEKVKCSHSSKKFEEKAAKEGLGSLIPARKRRDASKYDKNVILYMLPSFIPKEETMRMTFYVVGELPSFTVICLLRFMYVQV